MGVGLRVGVLDGVGVSVIVGVGGWNRAVWVRAAAAVSKTIVSTAPGTREEAGDPGSSMDPQAEAARTIPNKRQSIWRNFGFFRLSIQVT